MSDDDEDATVEPSEFIPGEFVVDSEVSDPNRAVVVNTPHRPAKCWDVGRGRGTVADDNPDYPADDPIVVVVYADTLMESYPHYTGGNALSLSELARQGVKYYAFPESRLDRTGEELGPVSLSLDNIQPSPYHARNFDAEENQEFIEQIRADGEPPYPPLVQVIDDDAKEFRVVNGHKRIWASYVAGLDEVECYCWYVDDETAARQWVRRHLDDYGDAERRRALTRLADRFDDIDEWDGTPDTTPSILDDSTLVQVGF